MTVRPIKSAERTLRLFELFAQRQVRLTVTDVGRGLEIPQPSASMLLANLTSLGYLEFRRIDRSYAPTIRVALLAGWVGFCLPGARSLASALDELHEVVGEDAFVCIKNGASAQLVQARGIHHKPNIDSGRMYSLTRSAGGQALLASMPDSELIRVVRRCNAEADSSLRVNEAAFLLKIQEIRRLGYAYQSGYHTADRAGIAIHIATPTGATAFAVGCGGEVQCIQAKQELIMSRLRQLQTVLRWGGVDSIAGVSGAGASPARLAGAV